MMGELRGPQADEVLSRDESFVKLQKFAWKGFARKNSPRGVLAGFPAA
jgi:hypothetical protein